MHGVGLDMHLQNWFDFRIPKTTIRPDFIEKSLTPPVDILPKDSAKLIWIGSEFSIEVLNEETEEYYTTFYNNKTSTSFLIDGFLATWLIDQLYACKPESETIQTVGDMKAAYTEEYEDFALFWYSEAMVKLRELGLLVL